MNKNTCGEFYPDKENRYPKLWHQVVVFDVVSIHSIDYQGFEYEVIEKVTTAPATISSDGTFKVNGITQRGCPSTTRCVYIRKVAVVNGIELVYYENVSHPSAPTPEAVSYISQTLKQTYKI